MDLSKVLGPSWSIPEDAFAKSLRAIQDPTAALMKRSQLEPAHLAGIRDLMERQSSVADAARRIAEQSIMATDTLRQFHERHSGGILAAQRAMDAIDLSGATAAGEAMRRAMLPSLAAGDALAELNRSTHWASALSTVSGPQLASLFPDTGGLRIELDKLHDVSSQIRDSMLVHERAVEAARAGIDLSAHLNTTVIKLSAFAGASDIFGPRTALGGAAFDTLFGRYRTTIDLPAAFWRHSEVRREIYEEANVDRGLIEADNEEVIDILIGSGVATQVYSRNGRPAAVFSFGQFEMRLTATRTRHDAYALIDEFEVQLRNFISQKMATLIGRDWFKQRVHGDVLTRVKERRREALRNGEPPASLINFSDLGDLMAIVLRPDNWDAIFSATFQRPEHFRVDMERLVAMRRPAMHARSMDSVRVLEIVCVVRRLIDAMDYGKALDAGWDEDQ